MASLDHYSGGRFLFGVDNDIAEKMDTNQRCKEPIIIAYIAMALAKSRKEITDKVSFIELFCADAYYAMIAKRLNADKVAALDSGKHKWFKHTPNRLKEMGFDKDIELKRMDVNEIDKLERYDIVANIGGLYHVKNPKEILQKSYDMAKKFLIVQSVVKMNFHPGLVTDMGWNIIDSHKNVLKFASLDSYYYLIKKVRKLLMKWWTKQKKAY